MAERVSAKLKRKKKDGEIKQCKNKREKKIAKEAKNYTRSLREIKCAYSKKNDSSLELNEVILEAFCISKLRELNI